MLLAIGIVALVGIGAAVAVVASGDDGTDDTGIDTGGQLESEPEPADEPLGVPGPCTGELDVLSAADIEAAVGLPVSEGFRAEDSSSCDFPVGDSTLSVTIERYDDPVGYVDAARGSDTEDVSGVGEAAIYNPTLDSLDAGSGDIRLHFFYSGSDEAFTVDTFALLAQTVFERTGGA